VPIVHVNVRKGFGEDKATTMIQNMTQVLVDLDIPPQAAKVVVHEIPRSHWGTGGQPASEEFKDTPTPKSPINQE